MPNRTTCTQDYGAKMYVSRFEANAHECSHQSHVSYTANKFVCYALGITKDHGCEVEEGDE